MLMNTVELNGLEMLTVVKLLGIKTLRARLNFMGGGFSNMPRLPAHTATRLFVLVLLHYTCSVCLCVREYNVRQTQI
jgi:hypothetical protein